MLLSFSLEFVISVYFLCLLNFYLSLDPQITLMPYFIRSFILYRIVLGFYLFYFLIYALL